MEIIKIKQATKLGYIELFEGGVADMSYPSSKTRRGRVQEHGMICPTLAAEQFELVRFEQMKPKVRIRKLTDRECGRLMNFDEKAIDAMESVNSATQCYKECGNSIVVACLIAIFTQMGLPGVPRWNDMTDDERYALIYKGCVPDGIAYKVETPTDC